MNNIPEPDNNPKPNEGQKLTITPDGVEVYHALRRGRQFVTLHYRKDKPVRLDAVQAWIGSVLDDLAQADLIVSDNIKVTLVSELVTSPTSKSAFTASMKLAVRPRMEVQEESAAWIEAMRAQFARSR